jgi:hypothetical protein
MLFFTHFLELTDGKVEISAEIGSLGSPIMMYNKNFKPSQHLFLVV